MTSVIQLFRHPLKSHGREEMQSVALTEGQSMPWDRLWAVAHDASEADGSAWAPCENFSRGSKAPALMAINAALDEAKMSLTLTHPDRPPLCFQPDTESDKLIEWVRPLVPQNRAMPDRILRLEGRGFTDTNFPSVSLCNLASHRAVAEKSGQPLSNLRWRGNIWFDTDEPWSEFQWVGRDIAIGGAVLRARERIVRCLATTSNPKTGVRDVDTLAILNTWDHQEFGIYAVVVQSGAIAVGDGVKVI